MGALALLEDLARGMRHERVFRDHQDYLAHEDEWLISRFRLPRVILLQICAELTLRELADRSGISQLSLSVIMPALWRGLIALTPRYIKFPYTAVEQANIKTQFVAMSGFPNVIGAIDGTHVAIKAATTDEYAYVNRKQYHSVNVQIIWDAEMTFLNVVARWPGSTHDFFMLRQSSVGRRLQAGAVQDGWLLGDSGYSLTSWLLTPFPNPQNQGQQTYNDVHACARVVVERSIGLLKSRWRCLDKSGGVLQYTPEKVCNIIRACAFLHNMAQRHRIPAPAPILPDDMGAHAEIEDHAPRAVELCERVMRRLWTASVSTRAVGMGPRTEPI
ncbi:putative nuclease HARBI1 [Merluccius polli]|uniref:Nuclease HARBI1 n=1 Tax=Merluccius polli TaxID=89951 RepID=A0AA47MWM2_MERPO|nr:putative nuclease HARBI1 [Merluccius polli]